MGHAFGLRPSEAAYRAMAAVGGNMVGDNWNGRAVAALETHLAFS